MVPQLERMLRLEDSVLRFLTVQESEAVVDIEARKKRWLEHGVDVVEIDHSWCYSIYATDPNGILVEFCVTTAEMTDQDAEEALRLMADPTPEVGGPPPISVHRASEYRGA